MKPPNARRKVKESSQKIDHVKPVSETRELQFIWEETLSIE